MNQFFEVRDSDIQCINPTPETTELAIWITYGESILWDVWFICKHRNENQAWQSSYCPNKMYLVCLFVCLFNPDHTVKQISCLMFLLNYERENVKNGLNHVDSCPDKQVLALWIELQASRFT